MKKVGIMTMHRVKNYGSFLQAYGLKKIITSMGYEVEFVDYKYDGSLVSEKTSFIKKILKNINVFKYIKRKKVLNKYLNRFEKEFIPELCSVESNYNKDVDVLVIGSDEVFNCMQGYPVGYSKNLFGYGYEKKNVLSYAASFGQTSFENLVDHNIDKEISSMLNKFKAISVRDDNSYNVAKQLTKKDISINLDPVLITDYNDEVIDNVNIKDYIIIYAYPDRLSNEEKKAIKKLAKLHNKKIVSFGMFQDISDIEIVVHPFEILSYFKHADFVITDTFHGSIFSIKNNTNFCTIVRNNMSGNSNKLQDLLNRLGLGDRILTDLNDLEKMYQNKPNYNITNEIIKKETVKAKEYLKKNI